MKHVLAVDDNPTNLTLVRETLKDDFKVSVVTSGELCLKFLEKKDPDIVLLDYCMPGMDGPETLGHIMESYGSKLPVIIMTALADQDMLDECRQIGAVGCIPKPFSKELIVSAITDVIGK